MLVVLLVGGMEVSSSICCRRQARFYACVVRSVVLTAVCIAGDIVDAVAASVISGQNTERWTILVAHQMHIVLNLMCMVFCFVHWRDILLPHSARNLHLAVETSWASKLYIVASNQHKHFGKFRWLLGPCNKPGGELSWTQY